MKWAALVLTSLFLLACGDSHETFRLEGTLKGFNQGELYIYGYDGTHSLDTVAVVKGQFRYEIPLEDSTTFVLVFPNFSELPIYGVKTATVELEGDASHLREIKLKGLKENEELAAFRQETSQQSPAELAKSVAQFIQDHPASPFNTYLLRKYFIQQPQPDYAKAVELAKVIQKANPKLQGMGTLIRQLKGQVTRKVGGTLPAFTATDINGQQVKSSDLNAKVNVITVWANWNYESIGIQRRLQILQKLHKDEIKVVSFCLDADVKVCRRFIKRDSVTWSTICDGREWAMPAIETLGLSQIPDNIVTDSQGKIIAMGLNNGELYSKIEELFPKDP